jgi:hypothetical protein
MPIRPSSSAAIQQLIAALGGSDDVRREAAIARLAVIGPRAIEHLLQEYPLASTARHRAGMLRALEASHDSRAVALAREGIDDDSPEVSVAVFALLRAAALGNHPHVAREALDALVATALDRQRPGPVRLAAFDAMRDLPASVVDPVRAGLGADPDPQIAAGLGARARPCGHGPEPPAAVFAAAVDGTLPATPELMKEALQATAPAARLTELQRVIDHIRGRELREVDPALRSAWRILRGAAHQALAARGSRLALYDLRDSLTTDEGRLPVSFLAALEEIGDASCIEPLAAAYDASSRSGDAWWRDHVAAAFRAIVQREGLTRRHLVVKRALTRWSEATSELMARS